MFDTDDVDSAKTTEQGEQADTEGHQESTGSPEDEAEDIIYAFSSVSRDQYIQDIYDSLALPPEFTIEFRYREPWQSEEVENFAKAELEGKEAVIIATPHTEVESEAAFAEMVQNCETRYGFFPLRRARVTGVREQGDALYLTLTLSERLVGYPNDLDHGEGHQDPLGVTGSLNQYPRFGVEGDENDVFVSYGSDRFDYEPDGMKGTRPQHVWTTRDCEQAWYDVVRQLGRADRFNKTLFYRLVSVTSLNEESPNPNYAKRLFGSNNVGYQLDAGEQYALDISLSYAGDAPDEASTSSLELTAGEGVEILPAKFDLGFRTERKELIIDLERALTPRNTILSLTPKVDFWAPELDIPLRVSPQCRHKYGPYAAIFLGIFIVAAST